jgi:hypothetical protein
MNGMGICGQKECLTGSIHKMGQMSMETVEINSTTIKSKGFSSDSIQNWNKY